MGLLKKILNRIQMKRRAGGAQVGVSNVRGRVLMCWYEPLEHLEMSGDYAIRLGNMLINQGKLAKKYGRVK